MPHLSLKPTHAPVRAYYKALEQYGRLGFDNEGNIRNAFEDLLKKCASQFRWTVVPEYHMSGKDKGRISTTPPSSTSSTCPAATGGPRTAKTTCSLKSKRSSRRLNLSPHAVSCGSNLCVSFFEKSI